MMKPTYDPSAVESRWYSVWEDAGAFRPEINPGGIGYCIISGAIPDFYIVNGKRIHFCEMLVIDLAYQLKGSVPQGKTIIMTQNDMNRFLGFYLWMNDSQRIT